MTQRISTAVREDDDQETIQLLRQAEQAYAEAQKRREEKKREAMLRPKLQQAAFARMYADAETSNNVDEVRRLDRLMEEVRSDVEAQLAKRAEATRKSRERHSDTTSGTGETNAEK